MLASQHRTVAAAGLALAVAAKRLVAAEPGLQLNHRFNHLPLRRKGMTGAEIVIGVIIGVLFELWSNTEGTPHKDLAVQGIAK